MNDDLLENVMDAITEGAQLKEIRVIDNQDNSRVMSKEDFAKVLGGLVKNNSKEGAVIQKFFSSWQECSDYVLNEMNNWSAIFFTSDFRAFEGQLFYGNIVYGFVLRALQDNITIMAFAIDGTISFRRYNYNTKEWDAPKIIARG